jgi:hypothetical protein
MHERANIFKYMVEKSPAMKNLRTTSVVVMLAAALVVSMIATPAAYASWATIEDASDFANDDFDIRTVGITDDGNLRLTVDGTAGGTIPSSDATKVYAYVFVTDVAGLIAVTSHQAEDSGQVGNDLEWHTHLVTLDDSGCVATISDFGKAKLQGNRLDVLQTGATSIGAALTAELTISGGVCVSALWDLAA